MRSVPKLKGGGPGKPRGGATLPKKRAGRNVYKGGKRK